MYVLPVLSFRYFYTSNYANVYYYYCVAVLIVVKSGFYTDSWVKMYTQGNIIITFIVEGYADDDGSDDEDLRTMKDEVVWLHACLKL